MAREYKYKVTRIDNSSCGNIPMRYRLIYDKGTNVYARTDTLGVMTFESRKHAEYFMENEGLAPNKIKRVLPIGRGKRPEFIALSNIKYFYQEIQVIYDTNNRIAPPAGTICYPGVFVCD